MCGFRGKVKRGQSVVAQESRTRSAKPLGARMKLI
jgi:hypothetical protein